MIPTLSKMNEAIENHVRIHKESIEANSILKQNTAMHVRLDLVTKFCGKHPIHLDYSND